MINILPIPAFIDNYIWCLHNEKYCAVIDPGESEPVIRVLNDKQLTLRAILITHHHYDHTNGIAKLRHIYQVPVIGPKEIAKVTIPIHPYQEIALDFLELSLKHFFIPGHTLEHVAYYTPGIVFTGDTLFTAGCGRVFEGTPAQMYQSLCLLKSLPDNTLIYCGHEYTKSNLEFALKVAPLNEEIIKRFEETAKLREEGQPTVPASLAVEKMTNPFLRCDHPEVIQAASQYYGQAIDDPIQVFEVIRAWKNVFTGS